MAHQIIPVWYSTDGSISDPSSATALDILKVERTPVTVRQSRETARWSPGHILVDYFSTLDIGDKGTGLRPKNDLHSTKPKCHQSKISDTGIKLAVLQIPFGIERRWIRKPCP